MSETKTLDTVEWDDLVAILRAVANAENSVVDGELSPPSIKLIRSLRTAIDEYDREEKETNDG